MEKRQKKAQLELIYDRMEFVSVPYQKYEIDTIRENQFKC